ncbi:energy transducer TonB [Vibrio mexicanus]|uniref:energy transducer TonB n=1 Tax=Vibrio mexicanus TaxID=1004326 RepID=UPI00069B55C9|nr:energy transducer TonB [Vibrio mexicanus]
MIEVWLDEDGKQIKQNLIQSSGHQILDERALKTIKEWQFSRRLEDGIAVAHRVHIPINFKLR